MSSDDMIIIEGLRVFGRHGVTQFEKEVGRAFVVDVECNLDLEAAGATDSLRHTMDYHSLIQRIQVLVSGERFDLLETLAERIAALTLADSRVDEVTVRVSKPSPPLEADIEAVAVEIRRRR